MARIVHLLLVIAIVEVKAQFFDFLSGFQPQTLRPIFETTRAHTTRLQAVDNKYIQNGGRTKFSQHHTTPKPIGKTTKPSRRIQNKNKQKIKAGDNYSIDKLSFDDGRNAIVGYETTKLTTADPFARRGFEPAVVDGPPITNRPVTNGPYAPRPIAGLQSNDDSSLTPELIVGPNEDFMTPVDRSRYIETAEKMCDEYASLGTIRVEAIPLVPSPRPVVVNVSSCARSVPLVVGGSVVTIQQFPHMALLGWTRMHSGGYSWKCGGSLVSDRYVLTAAHCAYQDRDDGVVNGPPRAIQLGSSRRDDPGAIVIRVSSVIRHPKYRPPQSYYDIAVVKMMKSVTFSAVIKPACLGVPPPPGEHIIATGWGKTEFGGDESEQLRGVSLPVWSMEDCVEVLGASRKLPHGPDSSQTCAGDRRGGGILVRWGDSGGPAQRREGCAWRVLAVTSTGRACGAADTPAIYANVQVPFVSKVVFGDEAGSRDERRNDRREGEGEQSSNDRRNQWNVNSDDRQYSDSEQNSYNGRSGDSPQDRYNQQNSYNGQNSESRRNSYSQRQSNSQQGDQNRQNNRRNNFEDQFSSDQRNQRQATSNPLRNEAWNANNNQNQRMNRRNDNRNPYEGRDEEDSTARPQFYYEESIDRPYRDIIWQ